ncbi:MAG: hypothetical protein NVSMB51_13400 [Solirubrobacteraceae bacterium]
MSRCAGTGHPGSGGRRGAAVRGAVRSGALDLSLRWAVRERGGAARASRALPRTDPSFLAICVDNAARGLAAYLRIAPEHGELEIGHICLGRGLICTRAATDAFYLLLARTFDELGYRRCECKCDALNAASRAAAERIGFTFEGVFRQAMVVKRRNRDAAWYSVIDRDWQPLRAAVRDWLEPANFYPAGRQRRSLTQIRAAAPKANLG